MRRALWILARAFAVASVATMPALADPKSAVEAFVGRLAGVEIRDLIIHQSFTLYHPDGLHPAARGEERLVLKPPGRQRVERTIDGQREVRLIADGRVWVRRADGKTYEAPPLERERDRTGIMVPFRRSAAELLAEWRALGVRDDVGHEQRVGRRTVTVIGAPAGDRDSPAVWLDPDYGVVRFISRERLPKGPALIDLTFSEHRPLAGAFHFPWRQEAFVDGKLALLITVRSVVANVGPSDALFDPDALRRER